MKLTSQLLCSTAITAVTAMLAAAPAIAKDEPGRNTMVDPAAIKWMDAPPNMPKGGKLAVLQGDPSKPGPFTIRLKAPAGYKIAPHTHTQDENLTVISGAIYLGMGEKVDAAQAHALKAGGFHYLPGKTAHYAFTKTPSVVQVHGEGPFDLNYINPADNPDKTAAAKQ
jgi:anti-sigma factor ChrR (cupin superfamily)